MLRPLMACTIASLLGACTSGGPSPTLTIEEAYVAERTDAGTVVHVVLNATNTSDEPMPLWHVHYAADIAGRNGTPIGRWSQATLAGHSTLRFALPVLTDGTSGQVPVSIRGDLEYVPGGKFRELLTEVGISLPRAPFVGNTTVDLSASPFTRKIGNNSPTRVATAALVDPPPAKAADTLPPLKP